MKVRKRHIVKTPKPYQRPGCKSYCIKVTGLEGKRCEINLRTSDKKEAKLRAKRESDLLNSQLDGNVVGILTISEMVDRFFQSKNNITESTRKRNKQHMQFFKRFMSLKYPGVRYFNDINEGHIAEFQIYRLEETGKNGKKIAPKTVKESVYVLNNIFEWALRQDYVHINPVCKVEKIKVPYIDQHSFSDEEVILILGFCKTSKRHKHLYAPYLVFATTGLRSGEVANLVWDDIDFERRVIKIRTKELPDGRTWSTKTKQNRELKMDDEVFSVLSELKTQSNSVWVFINTLGRRQTGGMLWQNLQSICKRLNIKRGQVHSFRRGFAIMMDKAVNDRVAIKETLGHATMTMTDRYCGYRPKEYIDKAHLKTTSEFIKKLKAFK